MDFLCCMDAFFFLILFIKILITLTGKSFISIINAQDGEFEK